MTNDECRMNSPHSSFSIPSLKRLLRQTGSPHRCRLRLRHPQCPRSPQTESHPPAAAPSTSASHRSPHPKSDYPSFGPGVATTPTAEQWMWCHVGPTKDNPNSDAVTDAMPMLKGPPRAVRFCLWKPRALWRGSRSRQRCGLQSAAAVVSGKVLRMTKCGEFIRHSSFVIWPLFPAPCSTASCVKIMRL